MRIWIAILSCLSLAAGLLVAAAIVFSVEGPWETQEDWGTQAPIRNGQQKWRIGYYEGGPYRDYPLYLRALVNGLADLGWIEPVELQLPPGADDAAGLWRKLSQSATGEYIAFSPEACWSADWDPARRRANRAQALEALRAGRVDLMIAMGTQAGLDLRDGHDVPTLVVSATDPIQSGIIDSAQDSGRDHLFALCDPDRYQRQARAFYNIVQFQRVGVVMNESDQARVYAHLDDLEKVAREFGFEIVTIVTPDEQFPQALRDRFPGRSDEELAALSLRDAPAQLAPKVQAAWITDHRGFDPEFMPWVLEDLFANRVVTWSPTGSQPLHRGVIFGMPERDLADLGRRNARVMAAVFHGRSPRDLPQVYEAPRAILINQAAAQAIGFQIPHGLYQAADEVYTSIEGRPLAREEP